MKNISRSTFQQAGFACLADSLGRTTGGHTGDYPNFAPRAYWHQLLVMQIQRNLSMESCAGADVGGHAHTIDVAGAIVVAAFAVAAPAAAAAATAAATTTTTSAAAAAAAEADAAAAALPRDLPHEQPTQTAMLQSSPWLPALINLVLRELYVGLCHLHVILLLLLLLLLVLQLQPQLLVKGALPRTTLPLELTSVQSAMLAIELPELHWRMVVDLICGDVVKVLTLVILEHQPIAELHPDNQRLPKCLVVMGGGAGGRCGAMNSGGVSASGGKLCDTSTALGADCDGLCMRRLSRFKVSSMATDALPPRGSVISGSDFIKSAG
eukprot:CAMPEP_0115566032 /NCGR_PEP_ID=MMETSP0271-20121206/103380_1 /TAXON_ID=71861 /ORGANISM="Scrippsiella trochoidea, Strain CCMP3099" /LENGTH=323 /DNA_ID=CAMNT_0003000337 /DNA_START=318 /DNA_END=1291 /DNA_ORIENTATION=+